MNKDRIQEEVRVYAKIKEKVKKMPKKEKNTVVKDNKPMYICKIHGYVELDSDMQCSSCTVVDTLHRHPYTTAVLNFTSEQEDFLAVVHSPKPLKELLKNYNSTDYNISVLYIPNIMPYEAVEIDKKISRKLKNYRYEPVYSISHPYTYCYPNTYLTSKIIHKYILGK